MENDSSLIGVSLYVEHLARNRRRDPFEEIISRPSREQLRKRKVDPAPPLRAAHTFIDYSMGYTESFYKPKRPRSMPRVQLDDAARDQMEETIRAIPTGHAPMPVPGWRWVEKRLTEVRTVTEDDLGELKRLRAEHARDAANPCKDAATQTDEPLSIYEITRSPNAPATYDTYVSAMVVARNEDEAKYIHPRHECFDPAMGGTPWWVYDGDVFKTRQEAYDDATHAAYRYDQPEARPPCPPHWLGRHSDWVHPGYVRAERVSCYDGKLKAGSVLHSSFWDG